MWPSSVTGTLIWKTEESQCFLHLAVRRIHCLEGWHNSGLEIFLSNKYGVGPGAHISKEDQVSVGIASPRTLI